MPWKWGASIILNSVKGVDFIEVIFGQRSEGGMGGNHAGAGLCTLRAISVSSEDQLCMEPAYRQLRTRSLVKRDE